MNTNHLSCMTIMTRMGVTHPSRLGPKEQEIHYMNRNSPRKLQAINRQRKLIGKEILRPGSRY